MECLNRPQRQLVLTDLVTTSPSKTLIQPFLVQTVDCEVQNSRKRFFKPIIEHEKTQSLLSNPTV